MKTSEMADARRVSRPRDRLLLSKLIRILQDGQQGHYRQSHCCNGGKARGAKRYFLMILDLQERDLAESAPRNKAALAMQKDRRLPRPEYRDGNRAGDSRLRSPPHLSGGHDSENAGV